MTKGSLIPVERIQHSILLIRKEKVMLDTDLAELYGVETKVLLQAVKRNLDRFPGDFMFHVKQRRIRLLEVTICDLKSVGWPTLSALCLY